MSYQDRLNPYDVHLTHHPSTPTHYQSSNASQLDGSRSQIHHSPSTSSSPRSSSHDSTYGSPSISKQSTPTLNRSSSQYLTLNENRIVNYPSKSTFYVKPVPSYEAFVSQPSLYDGTSHQIKYPPIQIKSAPRKSKPIPSPPTPLVDLERSSNERNSNETLVCPICGKVYSRQSNLVAHTRDTHSSQKNIFCDVEGCDRVYKRISECRRHKRDMHGIPLPSELAGKSRKRNQNSSHEI